MKFNELEVTKQRSAIRSGRGISAGRGKTAGRGTKGQNARKSPPRAGFEGGQTAISMRLPKLRGFTSKRPVTENVYTSQLDQLKVAAIDNNALAEAGIVSGPFTRVKVIVNGEITAKKSVKLQSATKMAIIAIEKAGGSFEKVPQQLRPSKKTDKK